MKLTQAAIARPIFIFMLMVAAVLLGTLSYRSMRVELNPDVSFGVVTITTVYPGAGAEEVNNLVSRKIEDAVAGVNGLRQITSLSREGVSVVVVELELGINQDVALNDVRSKVDAIMNQLPTDARKPTVTKFDTSSIPILYLALNAERLDFRSLRDLVDDRIVDRFARIAGVGSVQAVGGDVREIQVRLRKERLEAYGIGILDVQRAIQAATMNVPSGRAITDGQEVSVRVKAEFVDAQEMRDSFLSITDPNNPMAKGRLVRLGDIAEVVDSSEERTEYARLDGRETIALILQKSKDGNAIEVTQRAKETIAQLEEQYRDIGLKIVITEEQAKRINEALEDLNFSLGLGILLVALIILLFLHDIRGTLIVSIAIPICMFAAFIMAKLFGFTINNLTMLGLSLAVGVLVDDAIVVIENIYRHLRQGEPPAEAAVNGRAEIGLAALAITAADVVVFLPIGFMGGIVGEFFRPMALSYVSAVLFSLLVSFTVTPMLASRWYRAGEDLEHPRTRFGLWFEANFHRLSNLYRRSLDWSLRHRWFVFLLGNSALVGAITFIAGGFGAMQPAYVLFGVSVVAGLLVFLGNAIRGYVKPRFLLYGALFGLLFPLSALAGQAFAAYKGEAVFKFQFFPDSDVGRVTVNVQLPPGSSLRATGRVIEQIEQKLIGMPDVKYVLSNVGSQVGGFFGGGNTGSNYGQVVVSLNDKKALADTLAFWNRGKEELRTRADTVVAAEVIKRIGRIPGAEVFVSTQSGVGAGGPAIQMSFFGDDRQQILDTAGRIQRLLQGGAVKGVINADLSSKPGKPEVRVLPDRARLADMGISVGELAMAMRSLYQGNDDTKYRVAGREYAIRVMLDLDERNDPALLESVPVKFVQGKPVYVGEVARLVRGTDVDKIQRRDRIEEVQLSADLLPGYAAGSVQAEINRWIEREKLLPPGVSLKPLGQADLQQREGGYLFGALAIGLVLVYMVLASLFNNLLYPFIIQISQPQAMVGAILALVFTDKPLNIVGFIGIITLVGLVGKNAILLVDYTNTLRSRGKNRHDAILEAGPTRLRPILMTTLALLLAMLPIALAFGRGSEFRSPLGIVIIGGMTLSTLLTLLVIPCSYTIFDDLSESFSRWRRRRSRA
ncbi:MAG: efflux RND transporter permease subunit [Fimbriimonadales bacterium]|nr:efflux RND transporter permease subunit [Fimbriimonadales bacterium]